MDLELRRNHFVILAFGLLIFIGLGLGCNSGSADKEESIYLKDYIHVAHTRIFDTVHQVIDPRMEKIDYSQFDMVLLGGDICEETSKNYNTLAYLDTIFDLKSTNTLWALGNHDNANLDYVQRATGRTHFYSYHQNGITFIVLYTQEREDWVCEITGKQMDLIENVTDTISESSHLVVMTHKLIWIKDHPDMKQHQGVKPYDWSCNYMITRNGWQTEIAPLLQNVENRGIEVIALAGDIGNMVNEFEVHSDDGIDYLASGTNPEKSDIQFLHFKHNLKSKELKWRFIPVESFLTAGQPLKWAEEEQ